MKTERNSNLEQVSTTYRESFEAVVHFCRSCLETLKAQLVQQFSSEFKDVQAHLIRQAVNEADALASLTGVPELLLPVLAEEKVRNVRDWAERQKDIRGRSQFSFAA